jgi:hypothetical protein
MDVLWRWCDGGGWAGNHRIRKISRASGELIVSTVCGTGKPEFFDSVVGAAAINAPVGLFAGQGLHDDSAIVRLPSSHRFRPNSHSRLLVCSA